MLVYWKVSSSYDSAQDSLAEWSPWKSNHSRRMHRGISAETPIPTGSAWNLLGSRMGNVKSTGLGLRNFKHFLPCHGLGKSLHPASSSVTLQSCCKDNAWESVFWTLQWPVNLGSSRCNSQKVQGLGQCMWLWTPDGRRAFSMPAVQKLSETGLWIRCCASRQKTGAHVDDVAGRSEPPESSLTQCLPKLCGSSSLESLPADPPLTRQLHTLVHCLLACSELGYVSGRNCSSRIPRAGPCHCQNGKSELSHLSQQ